MEAQAPKIDYNSETGVVQVRITRPNLGRERKKQRLFLAKWKFLTINILFLQEWTSTHIYNPFN